MKRFSLFINFLAAFSLSLLMSCVGTVQDTKVDINSLSEEDKEIISFGGLEKGQAISHDKIELEFTPIALVDANVKYYLYINGSQSPIELNPVSLDDALAGRKRYVVSGLLTNRLYKFKLSIKNLLTNASSKNEKELVIQTFDNKTADFKGITSVTKVTGLSATSIFVEWVPAKMDGVIVAKEFDPTYYEVTIIGVGGAQNLNNKNYLGLDRRVIKVPNPLSTQISPSNHAQYTSTIIDSLDPSTTYAVQVRAVNKLWYNFSIDPLVNIIPVDREVNNKFLKIKTDPATGTFDFNQDSLRVSNALGSDALIKVNAFWSPGIGTFTGYRIFLRKYPLASASEATVLADDKLSIEQMQGVIGGTIPPSDGNGRFVLATTDKTSLSINGLTAYEWYQFKIIQCRTTDCPVHPLNDPDLGIVSEIRAIRVQPSLAPFDGISRIDNPKEAGGLDEIAVNFDPPALSVGMADRLEVYCLDPDTVGNTPANYQFDPVPLTTTAKATSPVGRCVGLSLKDDPLLTDNKLIIKGVNSIPAFSAADATYCFAVFPAIRNQSEQIPAAGTFPVSDWVVRCITPEVKTPTIAQFGGLNGSCNPVQDTIGVNWAAPTGGIYEKYRIFYRAISGSQTFKFSDAIADTLNTTYKSVTVDDGITSKTLTNLRPGTRYRIGILTEIIYGTQTLYSEYNTTIKDCVTPMPIASFEEWTRVFAIGPKVDGRFPHGPGGNGIKRVVPENAKILEALNVDGIPYELNTDSAGNILNPSFMVPPGHYHASYLPTTFGDDFDGAFGRYRGIDYTASQNGIVSLGWKDMNLDFLDTEFEECQIHPTDPPVTTNPACPPVTTLKKDRKYGYKVFRSDDNRLSWKDITGPIGDTGISLVYARNFNYRKRPNSASVTTERMAFFTDYSVKSIFTDPEGRERGRILWYKIVPYFDKRAVSVAGGGVTSPNIIKVVLPPPNMALVKREIANRNACIEIDRETGLNGLDKSAAGHYACKFNGLGARPKGTPWSINNLVIDLGGDLLVDRFELGCQYTRGDASAIPEDGLSYFKRVGFPMPGATSDLKDFKGFRTDINGNDLNGDENKLSGCTTASASDVVNLESTDGINTSVSLSPNYKNVLYGDCLGNGDVSMATGVCGDATRAGRYTYKYPGAEQPMSPYNCTLTGPSYADDPQNAADRLNAEFRRNLLVQSEYGAVFYHRDQGQAEMVYPTGPGGSNLILNSGWRGKQKQCFINLAAIGSDGTVRARWFTGEDLNKVKNGAGIQSLVKKGMGQVHTTDNASLYDTGEYRVPPAGLRTSLRFDDTTPVGKVVTANSAKLPPMTGVSQELAQEYCSAYDIEIGISTDGSNFLATTLPMAKRLLRKLELTAAAHWPNTAINHGQSYNYTESRISNLEGTTPGAGTCNNSTKNISSSGITRNSTLGPATATYNSSGAGTFPGKMSTGSSSRDTGSIAHTEDCISEYGIQDLVGNVSELSPERIFCDYSKDQLWFGQYDGDPTTVPPTNSTVNESNSVKINDDTSGERLFWKDATLLIEKPDGSFREVGANAIGADAVAVANVAWPQINPNSGYCSVVDNNESFASQITRYRDPLANFYPVSISGGALNAAMIPPAYENKVDRESVNYLRNGDGAFLNFGFENLAPLFQNGNSLSITSSGITLDEFRALGPFFNPWVGLPMSCGGSSCLESGDNLRITTPFLNSKVGTSIPDIADYPIGNSQIFNIGISDTVHTGGAAYTTMDLTLDPLNYTTQIIDTVTVYLDGSVAMNSTVLSDWRAANSISGIQSFSGIRFALPRDTPLIFTNGGSYTTPKTGRYTSQVINGSEESTKLTAGPGFRCGVMIDSD